MVPSSAKITLFCVHDGNEAAPVLRFTDDYLLTSRKRHTFGYPEGVLNAGSKRLAISCAFSKNILFFDKSYAANMPPTIRILNSNTGDRLFISKFAFVSTYLSSDSLSLTHSVAASNSFSKPRIFSVSTLSRRVIPMPPQSRPGDPSTGCISSAPQARL